MFNDDYSYIDTEGNKRILEKNKEVSITPEQLKMLIGMLKQVYPLKQVETNKFKDKPIVRPRDEASTLSKILRFGNVRL